MGGIESPESARDASDERQPKPAGVWAGYLIFGLCLLVLIVFDAQDAVDHQWSRLALMIVVTVAFVLFPTGGAKWLRQGHLRRHRDRPGQRR